MNVQERNYISNIFEQTLYAMAKQFLSTEITKEVEDPSTATQQDKILEIVHEINKNEAPRFIRKLEQAGIDSFEDVKNKPEVLSQVMKKLERKMKKDAEEISQN